MYFSDIKNVNTILSSYKLSLMSVEIIAILLLLLLLLYDFTKVSMKFVHYTHNLREKFLIFYISMIR